MQWKFLGIALCLSTQLATAADPKIYHIEILIFAHPKQVIMEETLNLTQEPVAPVIVGTHNLPTAHGVSPNTLIQERALLDKQGYHPVLHIAWEQAMRPGHSYLFPLAYGHMLVQLTRYFNVSFQLSLPTSTAYFSLIQTRRMRSNELNYIDSPLYGILIKIIAAPQ